MSADLVVFATRSAEALAGWRKTQRSTYIGDLWEDDGDYLDADGFIANDARAERLKEAGFDEPELGLTWDDWNAARRTFESEPSIWIGQVSWLKAGLFEDGERYIPGPVMTVSQIVGDDGVVLTPGVAGAIMAAMNLPNRSIYGKRHVRFVSQQEYDEAVIDYRKKRDRRWRSSVPIGNRRLLYPSRNGEPYSGVAKRQRVKRWLAANMGATLIQESQ